MAKGPGQSLTSPLTTHPQGYESPDAGQSSQRKEWGKDGTGVAEGDSVGHRRKVRS